MVDAGLAYSPHLSPSVALNLEVGALWGRKYRFGTSEVAQYLLLPAALGLLWDPPATGPLQPRVGLDFVVTLYAVDAATGVPRVAPGGRARVGADLMASDSVGLGIDVLGGVAVAPGIDARIDPRFSPLAPTLGARLSGVLQW